MENISSTKQISINCKGTNIEISAERIINDDIDSILSDLQINTDLKEKIAEILFSEEVINNVEEKKYYEETYKDQKIKKKWITS